MTQNNEIFSDIDALRLLEKALDNDEQYTGSILNECESETDSPDSIVAALASPKNS